MVSQNKPSSTFWFGFALGTSLTVGVAYLFGTKKGRATLQKLLDMSENLEENLMSIMEEIEERIVDEETPQLEEIKPPQRESHSSIHSLLDKIKFLSPGSSKEKRFFVKDKQ